MDARVRRSMFASSIKSVKVKRFAEFNPEEHDETILSMLQEDTKRGEGIA